MEILPILEWIEATPLSIGIRESVFWYPFLIALHVMGTVTSVGLILALDLRLVGWGMRKIPVSALFNQLRPWSIAGIVYQMGTGLALWWSEPVKCYNEAAFWIKMIAMFMAFGNAFLFDKTVYPSVSSWDTSGVLPGRAKFAGLSSLVLWAVVIWGGRWTAY